MHNIKLERGDVLLVVEALYKALGQGILLTEYYDYSRLLTNIISQMWDQDGIDSEKWHKRSSIKE